MQVKLSRADYTFRIEGADPVPWSDGTDIDICAVSVGYFRNGAGQWLNTDPQISATHIGSDIAVSTGQSTLDNVIPDWITTLIDQNRPS